ncbi:MAG: hypothetical protein ACI8UR_000074 [Natronomonas sp.]|jgi:uncharacterized protein (DUF2267 family)|uniref:DUF2267 domain-containing protein n=1 Tax=Natronomonas sp. TaxID=2184060 RepID=UPI00398A0E19
MDFNDFTGEVQHRLELGKQGEAVRATRAVLTTISERIQAGEATDLAAPLPMEIDHYVLAAEHGQRFGYDEFVDRIAERAHAEEPDAAFHAQAIVDLLADVIPEGEIDDLEEGLPDEYDDLFELVDAESAPWPTS